MPRVPIAPYCSGNGERGGLFWMRNGRRGRKLCNNRTCPWCWWYLVHRNATVLNHIGRVAPNAMWVTLTNAPDTNRDRYRAIKRLRRALARRCGAPVEVGWVTEIGDKGGWHIHAIFHGPELDQTIMTEIWGSIVYAIPATYDVGRYMCKNAIGPTLTTDDRTNYDAAVVRLRRQHFEINAGMTFRHTKGFFLHDRTFDHAYATARDHRRAVATAPCT